MVGLCYPEILVISYQTTLFHIPKDVILLPVTVCNSPYTLNMQYSNKAESGTCLFVICCSGRAQWLKTATQSWNLAIHFVSWQSCHFMQEYESDTAHWLLFYVRCIVLLTIGLRPTSVVSWGGAFLQNTVSTRAVWTFFWFVAVRVYNNGFI